jgi:hypothetical protein
MQHAIEAIERITARRRVITDAHLFALADVAFFERLITARMEIALLERVGRPIAARTLREQVLCELEAWLMPKETTHVS